MKLLNKGQGWVARKIDEALAIPLSEDTRDFLIEMKRRHEANIHEMERLLKSSGLT